jgi:hypothetical protein
MITTTRDTVRTALLELLTTGPNHHAAQAATLDAVGAARRTLATHRTTPNPCARTARDKTRQAALSCALTDVLLTAPRDPAALRAALAELAAVALGWLDALPDTPDAEPDAEPF